MTVVGIIGLLAALAIPNFMRFQVRAKAAEGKLNLTAIRSAEGSYFGEVGTYVPMAAAPGGVPISTKRAWAACPAPITRASPGHCVIGFFPEGPTYYNYGVATSNPAGQVNTNYYADAASDIDGDGVVNIWGLLVLTQNTFVAPGYVGVNGCPRTGPLDNRGVPGLLNQVGPCALGDGTSIF
jgi:type IV pilus assembly protein PilA